MSDTGIKVDANELKPCQTFSIFCSKAVKIWFFILCRGRIRQIRMIGFEYLPIPKFECSDIHEFFYFSLLPEPCRRNVEDTWLWSKITSQLPLISPPQPLGKLKLCLWINKHLIYASAPMFLLCFVTHESGLWYWILASDNCLGLARLANVIFYPALAQT